MLRKKVSLKSITEKLPGLKIGTSTMFSLYSTSSTDPRKSGWNI